jgi:hypothetical protein
VEPRNVFRANSADSLTSEHFLSVDDRRSVRADGRWLPFKRLEPAPRLVGEPHTELPSVLALFDRVLYSQQRQFGLLAVSTDDLPVRVIALADYYVVDRPLRASAPSLRLIEPRPGAAKRAPRGASLAG